MVAWHGYSEGSHELLMESVLLPVGYPEVGNYEKLFLAGRRLLEVTV